MCIAQNPNFLPAHRRLVLLYQNRLKKPKKAAEHREIIRVIMERRREQGRTNILPAQTIRDGADDMSAPVRSQGRQDVRPILKFDPAKLAPARKDAPFATIVSGLPRSGTSLMMQMLAAGGIPPLHDGHRPADVDNPRGYFEFAPAKNLRADASWLPHAHGRALKLVAQLLPFLPPGHDCRIVFMERSPDEVLASQETMLKRSGHAGAALTPSMNSNSCESAKFSNSAGFLSCV